MQKLFTFFENLFYRPKLHHKLISYLLLPFSAIYCMIVYTKKAFAKEIDYNIPIISVGNIIVGGSGKTPFVCELAKRYEDSFIILRGYKRVSKGVVLVSLKGEILTSVDISGDEGMEYALKLHNSSVIVSEDRVKAIIKAKELGAKVIFLDDGHSKYSIKKFDILLKPNFELKNSFCLPSGAFRELQSSYKKANLVAIEDIDFKRVVKIEHFSNNSIFITAIANPERIFKYLPQNIKIFTFPDHYFFKKDELQRLLDENRANTILTTFKDFVKIKEFGFNINIIELTLDIQQEIYLKCDEYIKNF